MSEGNQEEPIPKLCEFCVGCWREKAWACFLSQLKWLELGMLGCFSFFFRDSTPSPSQPTSWEHPGKSRASGVRVNRDFTQSSTQAASALTGFLPVLKLAKNEAVNPSTISPCKHPKVMMTVPVSLNSYLALFFQVYKGEFQLPEFLKGKPQVLCLLPPLDIQ